MPAHLLTCPLARTLAARDPEVSDLFSVLGVIGIAIALLVIGGAAIKFIRKRVNNPEEDRQATSGLLDELRAARKRGDISDEEFEAAKKAISAKLRGQFDAAPTAPRKK